MESSYKQILNAIEACIMMVDNDGRIMFWSKGAEAIFGYTADEMVGRYPSKIYPSGTDQTVKSAVNKLAQEDEEKEWKGIRKDGSEVWVRVKTSRIYEEDGSLKGIAGISIDITQRKEAMQKLAHSEERYRRLLEEAPVGIVLHRDNEILLANKAASKLFGYKSQEEMEGLNVFSILSNVDKPKLEDRIRKAESNEAEGPETYKFTRLDGEERWLEARGTSVKYFGKTAIQSILIDITDIRNHEAELKELNQQFSDIADTIPGLLFQMVKVNGSYDFKLIGKENAQRIFNLPTDIFGGTFDELLKRATGQKVVDEEEAQKVAETLYAAIEKGRPWQRIIKIRDQDGELRWLKAMAVPQRANPESKVIYNGVAFDVTPQKQAEQDLYLSNNKLQELTAHLNEVREDEKQKLSLELHDHLGQELTGVKLSIHNAYRFLEKQEIPGEIKDPLKEKLSFSLQKINDSIQSTRKLAHELHPAILDYGINEALEWLCNEIAGDSDIHFHLKSAIDEEKLLPRPMANTFYRITQEGLNNIIKHSGAENAWVSLFENDTDLYLIIQDDGKGMSHESKKKAGNLGLLGMEERINKLGGKLEIKSEPDFGTRIKASFPKPGGFK